MPTLSFLPISRVIYIGIPYIWRKITGRSVNTLVGSFVEGMKGEYYWGTERCLTLLYYLLPPISNSPLARRAKPDFPFVIIRSGPSIFFLNFLISEHLNAQKVDLKRKEGPLLFIY